jgi:phage internal scaffolding protein
MTNPLRERRAVRKGNFGKGLTEQHHKKSTSMNFILDRYRKTGIIQHVNAQEQRYDEYPDSITLHQAMNIVASASSMFESLPSSIRKEFNNDPGQFIDFVQDEKNYASIKEMGLSVDHLPVPPDPVVTSEAPVQDPAPVEAPSTP